jgi:hypothetical protein
MSLLTIIQSVADRIGLARPSAVVTSTDTLVRQLLALTNEEGASLAKRCPWQALTNEWTFITTATTEQTNTPLPTDLDRFVADSFFNRTTAQKLVGPITSAEWQAVQAFPVYSSPYIAFREREGAFLVTPAPAAGDTIAYEYVSTKWAMSSADQGKTSFTSDDDTAALDEELIIQGVRWRWKAAKNLDYAEDFDTYERNVRRAIARDGGAATLSMSRDNDAATLALNVPDGSYGL